MTPRDDLLRLAASIRNERYPDSAAVLLCGSAARGETTVGSDLDLVILMERAPAARRESFRRGGWPVEAFIHDLETLAYFFRRIDQPSGAPTLMAMIDEGVPTQDQPALDHPEQGVPEHPLVGAAKALARAVLAEGPPRWSADELDASRYAVTALMDDLRAPRSKIEALGSMSALYPALATHYLRSRGLWAAKDKTIPRALGAADAALAERFAAAFGALARGDGAEAVIALSEDVLASDGGPLFEGYVRRAPADWRLPQG